MRPQVQDALRFAIDLFHSEMDGDALAHRAVLKLAAHGVPQTPLAVAGAALEILEQHKRDSLFEAVVKGLGGK